MHIIFKNELDSDEQAEVTSIHEADLLPILTLSDGRKFYIADEFDQASEAAVHYWKNVVENSPDELPELIGESVLESWEHNKEDGPGHEKVNTSLSAWIDNTVAKHPDIAFGHFPGCEQPVRLSKDLGDLLGFHHDAPTLVVYPVPKEFVKGTIPSPADRGVI